MPTFGNPSGAMLSLARRKRVLELAAQYKVLVVEDDPYGELYFGKQRPGLRDGRQERPRSDVVRGLARREEHPDRPTFCIGHDVQLRVQPAFRAPDQTPAPPF